MIAKKFSPLFFYNLIAVLFAFGIFCADQFLSAMKISMQITSAEIFCVSFFVFILLCIFLKRKSAWTIFVSALFFFLFGIFRYDMAMNLAPHELKNFSGKECVIFGEVLDEGREKNFYSGEGVSIRYKVSVKSCDSEKISGEKIFLYVSELNDGEKFLRPRIGDDIRVIGKLRNLRDFQNPSGVSSVRQMHAENIFSAMSAKSFAVKIFANDGNFWIQLQRILQSIRQHYQESLNAAMTQSNAGTIFGILFGGYANIREEFLESFTQTGIVHILSVSGSHVTVLVLLFTWLAKIFGLKKSWRAIFISSGILFYVLLSYAVVPAVRAGLMGICSAFSIMERKPYDGKIIFSLLCFLLLLFNPLILFSINFQLSFGATFGILYFYKWFLVRFIFLFKKIFHRSLKLFAISFSVTASVTLSTLPLLAYYFHQVALSAFLANLLVIPFIELIMIISLGAGMLAYVFPFAARVIFLAMSLVLSLVYEMTRVLANLPYSQIYLSPFFFQPKFLIVYALNLFAFLLQKRNWLRWLGIFLFVGLIFSWQFKSAKNLEMHFIDVGQGAAALMIAPNGKACMFDVGGLRESSFDMGERVIVPYLSYYGVRELETIFLSHSHEDHSGNLRALLQNLSVKKIVIDSEPQNFFERSSKLSKEDTAKTTWQMAQEGETFFCGDVKIEVVYAPQKNSKNFSSNSNELSNVYRVSFDQVSFLFTGDLIQENEEILLEQRKNLKSTVLSVAHHGSKTSTSENFLQAVSPKIAVISAGYQNSFGHPHGVVLSRLNRHHVKIYRTDVNGAMIFSTDGKKLAIQKFSS